MKDCFDVMLTDNQLAPLSSLGLAHVGDGVYELLVRTWLVQSGRATAKNLHRETVKIVRAGTQAKLLEAVMPRLTEEEQAVCRRGRNAHTNMIPKSATVEEYHGATALEALFGRLYLTGQRERIEELFELMMERYVEDAT